ncbi:acetyltransferase (GNAT) family protein [Allofrancisella inopinata]|uniref:GNAT family N-acetyltransferase n=1 Tax=Allofrancisella inopinata TaxID=1085647 RepID=A0AAE6YJW4_9GAMM|nr:GNAT family N-acetyltransferase [Allofrancisella inopinata]QIV96102.1 GNAT family N-acetyltransferase [Allofrancisella inopinata]TDT69693.1 acetyltransferase (GNAT) family protein [Allofrancisella inopinata]
MTDIETICLKPNKPNRKPRYDSFISDQISYTIASHRSSPYYDLCSDAKFKAKERIKIFSLLEKVFGKEIRRFYDYAIVASIEIEIKRAVVLNVHALPDSQRQPIGTKMLQVFENYLIKHENIQELYLQSTINEVEFYKNLHFEKLKSRQKIPTPLIKHISYGNMCYKKKLPHNDDYNLIRKKVKSLIEDTDEYANHIVPNDSYIPHARKFITNNVTFISKVIDKYSGKVKNRIISLGIAGKKINHPNLEINNAILPDRLAKVIRTLLNDTKKLSLLPSSFIEEFAREISSQTRRNNAQSIKKTKFFTSRDPEVKKLYNNPYIELRKIYFANLSLQEKFSGDF